MHAGVCRVRVCARVCKHVVVHACMCVCVHACACLWVCVRRTRRSGKAAGDGIHRAERVASALLPGQRSPLRHRAVPCSPVSPSSAGCSVAEDSPWQLVCQRVPALDFLVLVLQAVKPVLQPLAFGVDPQHDSTLRETERRCGCATGHAGAQQDTAMPALPIAPTRRSHLQL